MKIKILSVLCILSIVFCSAQSKPKQEKPPTQKEMQEMMKEAQKMLDGMSPEDKKMMDSLGIKMPAVNQMQKNMAGVSDKQLAGAWEDENRIVPKKDNTRIAAIPAVPLSTAMMTAYLQNLFIKINTSVTPDSKTTATDLYQQLKTEYKPDAIGSIATGLWMAGRNELAVYLMCKACLDDPSNTDNLNNLAAMITMNKGEEYAIPILNFLNKQYPRNSTILNNLGQAWFGLGEISKAEKFLDTTIRIYGIHPQANFTKSLIEENKGNKTEAINLVKKSLQHSYAVEKEEQLRKLGDKMQAGDGSLPPKTKNDPLNLGGFSHPAFPKSVDECIAMESEWTDFRQTLQGAIENLKAQELEAQKEAQQEQQQIINRDLAVVQASVRAGYPQGSLTSMPLFSKKASLVLNDIQTRYNRILTDWMEKVTTYLTTEGMQLTKEYRSEMDELHKKDEEQTGEGKANKDFCPQYKAASDKYLKSFNSAMEKFYLEKLAFTKVYLNDFGYYSMYVNWPKMYEVVKLQLKVNWLQALLAEKPVTFESITQYKCRIEEKKPGGSKLAEFDDVACQYHSEMNLVVYKISSDCSRMTTELNTKFIKLKLKQDMDKETFADQFMNCNVEVRASAGEKVKVGPVEVGVKLTGGAGFEIDRNGVSDIYVIGGAGASAGFVKGGVEGKYSIVSGHGSAKGTGMFSKK